MPTVCRKDSQVQFEFQPASNRRVVTDFRGGQITSTAWKSALPTRRTARIVTIRSSSTSRGSTGCLPTGTSTLTEAILPGGLFWIWMPAMIACMGTNRESSSTATMITTAICRCIFLPVITCCGPSFAVRISTHRPGVPRRWPRLSANFARAGRMLPSSCGPTPDLHAKSS